MRRIALSVVAACLLMAGCASGEKTVEAERKTPSVWCFERKGGHEKAYKSDPRDPCMPKKYAPKVKRVKISTAARG